MLNCEYCDYFKSRDQMGTALDKFSHVNFAMADINEPAGICEYANFIFNQSIEDMDIEYPCNMLDGKQLPEPVKIDGKLWRYNYIKIHKKAELKRINRSA